MRPVRRPIALLNHPVYQDPDGEHTYTLAPGVCGKDFHVPGCPKLKDIEGVTEVTGTYDGIFTSRTMPCKHCQPHGRHKVTLPDGTDRYRPMGPIAVGNHGDRDAEYGEYALCEQRKGTWRVREWAADGPAALARAAELGVKVILGPHDARHGLPIGPTEGQL
ncbi:hypothetical protein ACQPYK_49590 (plasmid) [Streptosporangium sp. CA-135522]|uniref:hypothetical protein n=1 Tax=Streptosporangium sp. CA-135522 TaxID=3240072 RepID=UPI003D8EE09F